MIVYVLGNPDELDKELDFVYTEEDFNIRKKTGEKWIKCELKPLSVIEVKRAKKERLL